MRLSQEALRKLIEREVKAPRRRPLNEVGELERPRVDDVMMLVEDDQEVFEGVENLRDAVSALVARVAKNEVGDEGWSDALESPDMYADIDEAIRRAVYQVIKEQLAKFDIEVR